MILRSLKALSDPPTEQVYVTARETTFIPAGHKAVILAELLIQGFFEKSECFLQPSPDFCKEHQLLAFSSLWESAEMIPVRFINPAEDSTDYKGRSNECFSVAESAEMAALNRVIADLPDYLQVQTPNKYNLMEVLKETKSSMDL